MEPTKNMTNCSPGSNCTFLFFRAAKIIAAAFILVLVTVVLKIPAGTKVYSYGAVREIVKLHTVAGTWNMEKLTSEHFYIKFHSKDRAEAILVLNTAEHFYHPVTQDFGFTPRARIPLILYSSKEELNSSFGWEAKESAMGVYWAGAIRVLSPEAWLFETDPGRMKEAFVSSGPMAHELTHLMVDYLTGGNYPRWFTEGMAQHEEYKLTGFEFNDAAGSLRQPLYTLKQLTADFDNLPNQSLAYRESFAMVRFIVHQFGEETLYELIKELGKGRDINGAMKNTMGMNNEQFEARWQEWALRNEPGKI